jgi:hypothetical protein
MVGLESVYAKLDRASFHARELRRQLSTAVEKDRWAFERDAISSAGVCSFRVTKLPPIEPQWSLILGDFLTNARAALDHLAWQLVLRDGGQPDRFTQFPIRETLVNSKGNPAPARIESVTDSSVIRAIEAVQPYASQSPTDSPLFTLNELVNIDKHHLLLVVAHALKVDGMWWGTNDGDPVPKTRVSTGPISVGEEVAWFDFGGSTPPERFDPHLGIEIRLEDGPLTRSVRTTSLLNVVNVIYMHVEHSVLSKHFADFFGEAPRHGASAFGPQLPI